MLFFFFYNIKLIIIVKNESRPITKWYGASESTTLVDDSVGFRDMPTAHAFKGTYRRRTKVEHDSDSTTNLTMKIQSSLHWIRCPSVKPNRRKSLESWKMVLSEVEHCSPSLNVSKDYFLPSLLGRFIGFRSNRNQWSGPGHGKKTTQAIKRHS